MSGVYARNRKQTHFDPVDVAARLQDAVTLYVMNEKRPEMQSAGQSCRSTMTLIALHLSTR